MLCCVAQGDGGERLAALITNYGLTHGYGTAALARSWPSDRATLASMLDCAATLSVALALYSFAPCREEHHRLVNAPQQ